MTTDNKKILIAESNIDLIESMSSGLIEAGYETLLCRDGGQAVFLLKNETFKAIIIDMRIPVMNGLQVASIARSGKENRRTPIIITSSAIDGGALERAERLGIADIIRKPFEQASFVDTVKKVVEQANQKLSYDSEIINVFIAAAAEVFEFYFKEAPARGKPGVKAPGSPARGSVTSLISFTGNGFIGSMGLSANIPFIKGIAHSVFPDGEISLDKVLAADLVGEMANQVLGAVKARFAKIGVKITLGLPEVVIGKNHIVIHKVKNPILYVPIGKGDMGCDLEFCLDKKSISIDEESKEEQHEAGSVLLF